MTQLPGVAGHIEDVIGLERAVTLLRARGGTEIEIPVRLKGSLIVSIIGMEAATSLQRAFGPGRLTLPCSHLRGAGAERLSKRRHAEALLAQGESIQAVALKADLHIRTVRKYKQALPGKGGSDDEPELPF